MARLTLGLVSALAVTWLALSAAGVGGRGLVEQLESPMEAHRHRSHGARFVNLGHLNGASSGRAMSADRTSNMLISSPRASYLAARSALAGHPKLAKAATDEHGQAKPAAEAEQKLRAEDLAAIERDVRGSQSLQEPAKRLAKRAAPGCDCPCRKEANKPLEGIVDAQLAHERKHPALTEIVDGRAKHQHQHQQRPHQVSYGALTDPEALQSERDEMGAIEAALDPSFEVGSQDMVLELRPGAGGQPEVEPQISAQQQQQQQQLVAASLEAPKPKLELVDPKGKPGHSHGKHKSEVDPSMALEQKQQQQQVELAKDLAIEQQQQQQQQVVINNEAPGAVVGIGSKPIESHPSGAGHSALKSKLEETSLPEAAKIDNLSQQQQQQQQVVVNIEEPKPALGPEPQHVKAPVRDEVELGSVAQQQQQQQQQQQLVAAKLEPPKTELIVGELVDPKGRPGHSHAEHKAEVDPRVALEHRQHQQQQQQQAELAKDLAVEQQQQQQQQVAQKDPSHPAPPHPAPPHPAPALPAPRPGALSEKCLAGVQQIEETLRELLGLVERLSQRALFDESIPFESRELLARRLSRMRSSAEEALAAARLADLRQVNESARAAGLELVRVANTPAAAKADPALRPFAGQVRHSYGVYRRACKEAAPAARPAS